MYSLERIRLGGVHQWITLRGESDSLPILLSLHGGPGIAMLPLLHRYCPGLERTFIVVSWDQRGAGKSFSFRIPRSSMTIEHFVSDVQELVQVLLHRFNRKMLFLLGHSWGSALGVWTAQRIPESIQAYIGVGQVSDRVGAEQLSLEFALKRAEENGNRLATMALKMVGPPPWSASKLLIQRYCLLKLGGCVYGSTNYNRELHGFIHAEEYTWRDLLKLPLGVLRSLALLEDDFSRRNLMREVVELKVPVYFLEGRHDKQVHVDYARQYFEILQAPRKRWIWFERSAHSPMYEESERFVDVMVNTVLAETQP